MSKPHEPPVPLRSRVDPKAPLAARAGRLLETADLVEPWPAADRQESWRRIAARVGEKPRPARLLPGFAGAALLILAGVLLGRETLSKRAPPVTQPEVAAAAAAQTPEPPAAARRIELGSVGTIEVDAATVYELLPAPAHPSSAIGPTLRLEAGRLCAVVRHRDPLAEGPLTVLTPKLRIVDVGTRFCVEVAAGRTAVDVSEGRVQVEGAGGRAVELAAGQRIASDDERFRPPVPAVAPPAPLKGGCQALLALEAREACDAAASSGEGLAAQNALYDLALLARDERHDGATALALFQAYRQRFPQGPLAPEASLGILTELTAEGHYAEAASEAGRYLQAHPSDAKAAQVGLMLGTLERERLGDAAAARAAYEQALRSAAEPDVAGEALFGLALSELQLGQGAEGQAALRRYLAEYPAGARAADAARLLAR
ncbi:MAG: FecR domain-containing protein [Myxococcales bacterium]